MTLERVCGLYTILGLSGGTVYVHGSPTTLASRKDIWYEFVVHVVIQEAYHWATEALVPEARTPPETTKNEHERQL